MKSIGDGGGLGQRIGHLVRRQRARQLVRKEASVALIARHGGRRQAVGLGNRDGANQIAQVDNDVLNQAALTQAAITGTAGLQTLDTRLQIELAMAQGLNVESFILPNTSGGYLQTVRSIASSIINLMQTDKQTIGTATKWLAQGDTALANRQYITAYQDYVAAYQAASK